MKRILSILLVATLLACSLPVGVTSQTVEEKAQSSIPGFSYVEEVYYTDLFTVYSQYLSEDGMAQIVNDEYQKILTEVYDEYASSSEYVDTLIYHRISDGIAGLLLDLSDMTGFTSFGENEAYDAANELFITEMFGSEVVMETLGADKRLMKGINLVSDFLYQVTKEIGNFEVEEEYELLAIDDIMTVAEDMQMGKYDSFQIKFDSDCWYTVKKSHDYIRENLDTFSKIFSYGTEAIDMIKSLYLAIVMEHARAEIVEDILSVAEPGTDLYKGLTRLNRQLGDNISDYIINTYLVQKGLSKFAKAAEKIILGQALGADKASYDKLSFVLSAAAFITYELILDVPKYSEVTSFVVLYHYADDMCKCIMKMQEDLATGAHDGHTVAHYENLWAIYGAIYKAVLKHGEKLANDDNVSMLTAGYNRYFGGNYNLYSRTMNRVLENIRNTPFEERKINPPDGISYSSAALENANLDAASNIANDNTIYAVNNYLYGNLNVSGNDADLTDLIGGARGIAGDLTVCGVTLTVTGNILHLVDGDLLVHGYSYNAGGDNTYYTGVVDIQSTLIVSGDMNSKDDSRYYSFKMSSNDSHLYLGGDQKVGLSAYDGTVVFYGNTQQEIMGNHRNVVIANPEGIKGSFSLHGDFDAKGNPFEGSVWLYDDAVLSEGTNFDNVYVSSNYTLKSDIYANNVYIHGGTLTVAANTEYTIDSDVQLYGSYTWAAGNTTYYYGILDIYGDLTVTGDITGKVFATDNREYYKLNLSDEDAVLRLEGDQYVPLAVHEGTMIFCGAQSQKITGTHNNITVTNPEGLEGTITVEGALNTNGTSFDGSVSLSGNAYLSEGTNYKTVYIDSDYTLNTNIVADTVYVNCCTLTVSEGTAYTIDADVQLYGNYSWSSGNNKYYYGIIDIYGDLTVTGDITGKAYATDNKAYYKLNLSDEDAILRLGGDQGVPLSTYEGTTVFCGDDIQTVTGTHKNITVTNPTGITGNVNLTGAFSANGAPFDGSVYLSKNATLSEGTNYGTVYIDSDYTLKTDICADTVYINRCTVTVAAGTAYTVDADIRIYGDYSWAAGNTTYYYGKLDIYGDLSVTGDITFKDNNRYSYVNAYEGSILRFAGDSLQTVNGLSNAYTVILENGSEDGVAFNNYINVRTLFDHNRNNYTAAAGGSFVDYDGDGMKDNEDPVPEAATGDTNGDGAVNSLDSYFLNCIISGTMQFTEGEDISYNADLNGDGEISILDGNLIKRKLAGA